MTPKGHFEINCLLEIVQIFNLPVSQRLKFYLKVAVLFYFKIIDFQSKNIFFFLCAAAILSILLHAGWSSLGPYGGSVQREWYHFKDQRDLKVKLGAIIECNLLLTSDLETSLRKKLKWVAHHIFSRKNKRVLFTNFKLSFFIKKIWLIKKVVKIRNSFRI